MYYFYLFRCKDNSLYSGSTKDLKKRELLHNSGKGAKYTKSRGGGKMIYSEKFKTLSQAFKREAEIKKWTKNKKELLAQNKKDSPKKVYVRTRGASAVDFKNTSSTTRTKTQNKSQYKI